VKIILLSISGSKPSPEINKITNDYLKKISLYYPVEHLSLSNKKLGKLPPRQLKKAEAKMILSLFKPGDFIILLDEKGKELDSIKFSSQINNWFNNSYKRLVFIIAGAFGAGEEVKQKCQFKLSLSKMTFTHQLIPILFLEQLYRGIAILHNHPYHNI
jgi:23S rRNA (pseudouridine1915-N3)-methyltransferase